MTERELAEKLGLNFIELDGFIADLNALRLVSRHTAKFLNIIPLALLKDGKILVAASDPEDSKIAQELRGREIIFAVASHDDISKNLDKIYDFYKNVNSNSDAQPVGFIADFLLNEAVKSAASDMHIENIKFKELNLENKFNSLVRVRFRLDGKLYTKFKMPSELHAPLANIFKLRCNMNIAENRLPQDGHFFMKFEGRSIDIRVNTFATVNGAKLAIRILDNKNLEIGLENLGFDERDLKIIKNFCELPYGILLATGPTGSGKSTTLYALLQNLNKPDVNIITVEDPVELLISGINQVQIHEKIGLDFNKALRAALRQDPDKIMVGEIRDVETAQTAIRAALTGHLVLSTIHTNDAAGAATRFIEMGVPAFLVAATLAGVISQRLVRKLCPHCKREYIIDDKTCGNLNLPLKSKAYRATGCEHCNWTGYKGRVGIFEIMTVDEEIRDMILNGATIMELNKILVDKKFMRTIRESGLKAVLNGVTSLEEILSSTI